MQLTIYEAARREERREADGGEPARDSNNQSIFISFRTRLAAAAQKKPRQLEIIQSHRVRCAPREGETQKARQRKGEREGGTEVKSDLSLDSFRRQFSLSLCRKATPQQQHEQQNPTTTTTKTSCNLIIYYGQGGVAASLLVAVAGSATCPSSPSPHLDPLHD